MAERKAVSDKVGAAHRHGEMLAKRHGQVHEWEAFREGK
jgi:hypothetical protein